MELSTILKAIGQMTLRSDFKEFFIKSSAEGEFLKSEFEEVQNDFEMQLDEEPAEEDEFALEIDEQEQNNSIKTYQFNNSMIAPSISLPPVIKGPPSINLPQCPCIFYGYNSKGRNTFIGISQNTGFRACGCSLFLCKDYHVQKPSDVKLYLSHKYPINILKFYEKRKLLLSGSIGRNPQVLVWKYKGSQDEIGQLELVSSFRQPRKSEGVAFVSLFKEKYVISIDVVSLHRSCSIYLFDMVTENRLGQGTKIGGKVFDMAVMNQTITVITDKGVFEITQENEQLKVQFKNNSEFSSMVVMEAFGKQRLFFGDRDGNIYNSLEGKKKWNIHSGWINILISCDNIIYSSGADQGSIKISEVDKDWNVNQKWRIQLKTYCTSLSFTSLNLLFIGCRDGSTQTYNVEDRKCIKNSPFVGSFQEKPQQCFYSRHSQRLVFPILMDTVNKALLIDFPPQKNQKQSVIQWNLKYKTLCMDIYGSEVIQIYPKKGKKYPIMVSDLTDDAHRIQINSTIQSKPTVIKYNGNIFAIGDQNGNLMIQRVKDEKMAIAKQKHSMSIEQIIWDATDHFIKTTSGSQLFYWQVKQNSDGLQIIKVKPKVVKEAKWTKISKYTWECKKVWEHMTHFKDISSVDKLTIGDKTYICVALYDGNLRIYNFPAAKNNYTEYKLFDGPFQIICEKNWITCSWKGMTICFEGITKEQQ